MTSYEERIKIIREEINERLEFTNHVYELDLSVESFEPFIKQRAKREVLTKKGHIKTSLIIEIIEIIKCAVSVAYKVKADFESRVCKNCKYFKSKSGLCGKWENGVMNEASFFNVDENFGCNGFERKKNENN